MCACMHIYYDNENICTSVFLSVLQQNYKSWISGFYYHHLFWQVMSSCDCKRNLTNSKSSGSEQFWQLTSLLSIRMVNLQGNIPPHINNTLHLFNFFIAFVQYMTEHIRNIGDFLEIKQNEMIYDKMLSLCIFPQKQDKLQMTIKLLTGIYSGF